MGLSGQQTTLAVTKLLAGLAQGYMEGMKLVREEHSRLSKLDFLKEREARAAAVEQERLSVARERLTETKKTSALQREKLRGDITLQGLRQKQLRKSMATTEDPFTGSLTKDLNTNFTLFKSAQDAFTDARKAYQDASIQWKLVQSQKISKDSNEYKTTEANFAQATNNLMLTRSRVNRLTGKRNTLLATGYNFDKSDQRGAYRMIARSLVASGYNKEEAIGTVNEYVRGLRLKDAGDPTVLQNLIERISEDPRIKPGLKLDIGNWLKRAAGERTNYVETRPEDINIISVEEAVRDYTPGYEEEVFEDPFKERAAKRLGITPEMEATDPEAAEALKQEVATMERVYGPVPTLGIPEPKELPKLRTETPLTEGERTEIKEKIKKGRKEKKKIKRSAYWSRHWSMETFGAAGAPPKHWSLKK
jgi:hypothetical protein